MNKKMHGFTFVELVLGMAIVGFIGVLTVPRFVAAAEASQAQARWDITVSAKNARSHIVDQTGDKPTVIALADHMSATCGKAIAGGIQVSVDGEDVTIPTYTNSLCNVPTRSVNDQVACVGSIQ